MRIFKYSLALALAMVTVAARADSQSLRDLTVEQAPTAQIVAPQAGSLKATISADHPDATYVIGEPVRLFVNTSEDAFVTVLDVGPSGQTTVLFPSKYQPDNHVLAGHPVEIAGAALGARVVATPPAGTELIKVIASNKPITVIPEGQLGGSGPFRVLEGGSKALVRDLQVVADAPAQPDTRIVFSNYGLYTVASRAPAAGQTVVVVPGAPAPSMVHVAVPAEQPFPLLLATDKTAYHMGDRATIAVTTTQACNLTVLEFTTLGTVRTLFPNASTPNPALGAMQTVFVAGGASSNVEPVTGPAGAEQILAVCAAGDVAALPAQKSEVPVDAGAASRDLTIVASRPGTSMASVIVSVQ